MPYIIHRAQLQEGSGTPDGLKRYPLVRGDVENKIEAGIELNVLAPHQMTPTHYHSGCEHYVFIVRGLGNMVIEGETHPVATSYLVAIDPGEKHSLQNLGDRDIEYLEFFVPQSGAKEIETIYFNEVNP